MRMLFALLLLSGSWVSVIAAPAVTVQGALKLIPKEQARNLVRIEAREGSPAPDVWYIQVYDPASETGLREFVVSQKQITANRTLSQFLDGAKLEDVVGARLVKVDSDDLIKVVQQYVEANNLNVTKINYTMLREATNPAPVWKIACFDDTGKKLGEMVINARNANVVSHDGFDIVPGATAKSQAQATPAPSPAASPQPGEPDVKPAVAVRPATAVKASPAPVAAAPLASATPKPKSPGLFHRMFGGKPTPTPVPPAPTPKNP